MQSIENGLPISTPLEKSARRPKRHLNAAILCSFGGKTNEIFTTHNRSAALRFFSKSSAQQYTVNCSFVPG
jgi:hypothetical protein